MSSIEQQNAAVQQECGACGAVAGEECAPLCLGVAAAQDEASGVHAVCVAHNGRDDASAYRAECECGWRSGWVSAEEFNYESLDVAEEYAADEAEGFALEHFRTTR